MSILGALIYYVFAGLSDVARGSSCSSDTLDDSYSMVDGGLIGTQPALLADTKSLIDSLIHTQQKYNRIPQQMLQSYYSTHCAPVSQALNLQTENTYTKV